MSTGETFELWIEWDACEQVGILRHRDVTLETRAQLERWRDRLLEELERVHTLAGGRFALLVDMAGFELKAACVHGFAEVVETWVRGRYTSAHARFSDFSAAHETVIVAARKTSMEPKIFASRAEALADVRRQVHARV